MEPAPLFFQRLAERNGCRCATGAGGPRRLAARSNSRRRRACWIGRQRRPMFQV